VIGFPLHRSPRFDTETGKCFFSNRSVASDEANSVVAAKYDLFCPQFVFKSNDIIRSFVLASVRYAIVLCDLIFTTAVASLGVTDDRYGNSLLAKLRSLIDSDAQLTKQVRFCRHTDHNSREIVRPPPSPIQDTEDAPQQFTLALVVAFVKHAQVHCALDDVVIDFGIVQICFQESLLGIPIRRTTPSSSSTATPSADTSSSVAAESQTSATTTTTTTTNDAAVDCTLSPAMVRSKIDFCCFDNRSVHIHTTHVRLPAYAIRCAVEQVLRHGVRTLVGGTRLIFVLVFLFVY
jgi:hypothetical protein